jgi:hypothetical protein
MSSRDEPIPTPVIEVDEPDLDFEELCRELCREIRHLQEANRVLRDKTLAQRRELRRLNDAHLRKNARIVNVEGELCALLGSIERSIRAGNLIIR